MKREVAFRIVLVIFVFVTWELLSWGFVTLSTRIGLLHFYRADIFSNVTDSELARDSQLDPLGWVASEKPRPAVLAGDTVCGYAFGDSFTYGAEVADQETWLDLLSRRLNCTVANYGNNGYGLDQAVLRYERITPEGKFILLGLYIEMIRRAVAASWTFYVSQERPVYSNIKPYFSLEGETLRLHQIAKPMTRAGIATHHAGDYYMHHVWNVAKFPNFVQLVQAGYRRVIKTNTEMHWGVEHPSGSGVLARGIVNRFVRTAKEHNSRAAVVLMPHVYRLLGEYPSYDAFADDLRQRQDVCVIETKSILREQARLYGPESMSAPGTHYNALGNQLIADAVANGLRRCNISP
jgi:lysophospholipase L1-like esterase